VVDLTRALPGTSQTVSRGSCNRLTYGNLDIKELQSVIDEAFIPDYNGELPMLKAIYQLLVEKIVVEDRRNIFPTFRVPFVVPAVRIVGGLVEVTSFVRGCPRLCCRERRGRGLCIVQPLWRCTTHTRRSDAPGSIMTTPRRPCRTNARPSDPEGSAYSPEILRTTALPVGATAQHCSAIRTQHVHPTRGLSTLVVSRSPCRRDRRFVAIGRVMIVGVR